MVSAPRREAAVPKLMRVRVEFSKKARATVLPRSVASFLSGLRWIVLKGPALVEKKSQLVRGERFKRQEIAEAKGHICTLRMVSLRNS